MREPTVKHGLVLSGGGAKGSWGAGAAAAVIEHYAGTDLAIRDISGTSVGALNAAKIASGGVFPLLELWRNVTESQVFSRSLIGWGLLRALRKGALYNTTPLRRLLERELDVEVVRDSVFRIYLHATKLGTRQSVVFQNDSPDLLEGVMASAALPGAFPPVRWRGHWLVDGGTVDNSPVRTLLKQGCQKVTVIYLDHELPASAARARDLPQILGTDRPGLSDVLGAAIESMMDSMFWRDLRMVEMVNRLVAAGHADPGQVQVDLQIIMPKRSLGDTLDFRNERMRSLVDAGYEVARAQLQGS